MKNRVDLSGFLVMVLLTLLWGLNYPAVKIANTGFAPVFNAFLRSAIASVLGIAYCISIKQPMFHRDIRLFHGLVAGLLFGLEFICIYWGMVTIHTPIENAVRISLFARQIDSNLIFSHCEKSDEKSI
jgi:drug/metabolite transporter (DMT)-like permease